MPGSNLNFLRAMIELCISDAANFKFKDTSYLEFSRANLQKVPVVKIDSNNICLLPVTATI